MSKAVSLHKKVLMACWWCGIGAMILFFIALGPLMGMIVPPDPQWSAEQLVSFIEGRAFLFKIGCVVGLLAGMLFTPWTCLVSYQVYRMEAGRPPLLSVATFLGGLLNSSFFVLPFIFWSAASYRVGFGQDPEFVRLINDITWLEFVLIFQPFALFLIAMSFAGLNSTARQIVLPRWYCYFALWVALSMAGGGVAILFKDGPFAWNGIIAWWMVLIMFSIFNTASLLVFRKAIKEETLEEFA